MLFIMMTEILVQKLTSLDSPWAFSQFVERQNTRHPHFISDTQRSSNIPWDRGNSFFPTPLHSSRHIENSLLMRGESSLFLFHFRELALQVVGGIILLARKGHEPGGIGEQVVHLLERQFLSLGQEQPEKHCVSEIADNEEIVVAVTDISHGDGRHLTDHGVERKRGHCGNGDTLRTCACVEYFGRDNPRKGAASAREGEVVQPGHDDEAPVSAGVVGFRREARQQDTRDDEGDHVAQIATNESPAAAQTINEQDAEALGDQSDD
jgi:hypothetical protein